MVLVQAMLTPDTRVCWVDRIALVRVLELWFLTVNDCSKIVGDDSNRLSQNYGR